MSSMRAKAMPCSPFYSHAGQPEFILRWKWRVDDVAFWDNRITQHYAVADYLPERRLMHRATVNGDRPV